MIKVQGFSKVNGKLEEAAKYPGLSGYPAFIESSAEIFGNNKVKYSNDGRDYYLTLRLQVQ